MTSPNGTQKRPHFATYLVNRGIIQPDQALKALDEQRSMQKPIGRICIEQGFLSIRGVFSVLNAQLNDPRPFGFVAVELGLLSAEQRDRAIAIQETTRPRLGEVMVQLGYFDEWTLQECLHDYFAEGHGTFALA